MSYILDALKKAEAERQRGTVPSLHAQPAASAPAWPDAAKGGRRSGVWRWTAALAVLGAMVVGVAAWWWFSMRGGAAPVVAPASAPPVTGQLPVATAAAPVPMAVVEGLPSPPSAPLPSASVRPPTAQPAPAATRAPSAQPSTQRATQPSTQPSPQAPRSVPAGTLPTPPRVTAEAQAKSPTSAPPAASAAPLPRLSELPEAQRRELPPLAVGGAVQSPDPASRMLIVDGQVLREGDAVTPALVLERIGPRAAVFSLRGLRFELPL